MPPVEEQPRPDSERGGTEPSARIPPRLAAAIVVGTRRDRAARALGALYKQTAIDAMEIVIIDIGDAAAAPLTAPPEVRLVYLRPGQGVTWAEARAEGVRHARAPIVAFVEEHCIPAMDWAEILIAVHEGPWAAVGYAFTNANPRTYVGRACWFADYGLWAHPAARGTTRFLPGNNVSYKRDLLLALGTRLELALGADFNVQEAFLKQRLPLFLEARALVAHENHERLGDLLQANHMYCRLLATGRARTHSWGWGRRLLYGLAVPFAAPILKTLRLARSLRGRRVLLPAFIAASPVILITYCWSAVGESLGYLLGAGSAEWRFKWWELESLRGSRV